MNKDLTSEIAVRQNFDKIVSFWRMLPDPDPILRKLGKDIQTYRELLTDPHLFSTMQQRKAGVMSMQAELYQLDSAQNDYDIINNLLFNDLDLLNITNQILDALFFGFSVFEIVWQKVGNYLLPSKVEQKPQEWFFFDQNNQLNIRKNLSSIFNDGEVVNPLKFILVQNYPSYNNPYGERLLSRCFWPVTFKRGGLKFFTTFTEKYGMPFLHGKLPRGSSQEEIDRLLNALDQMIQDAVAVTPDDSSIEIKEAAKTSSADIFEKFLNFQNDEISKAILTQTLTTDINDRGTYAASKTMQDMLTAVNNSDRKLVEKAINQLIKLIYNVNFNSKNLPIFVLYREEEIDKELAERDEILTRTGIKFTKNYYIKNYNLKDDDFELTSNQNFAEKKTQPELEPESELLNQISDKHLQLQIEQALKTILDMINNSESYDKIMEKLAELIPQMKTEQLENLLAKLIYVAEIEGMNQ